MGQFAKTLFTFGLGVVGGIYVSQNYRVPDVTKMLKDFLGKARKIEEENRR
jgi:hypothetical protein